MKTLGNYTFPVTEEEHKHWQPNSRYIKLGYDCIAVSITRREGKWCAYCGAATEGWELYKSVNKVLTLGGKLPEPIARAAFPEYSDVPYAP